jgi:hypothetical protein
LIRAIVFEVLAGLPDDRSVTCRAEPMIGAPRRQPALVPAGTDNGAAGPINQSVRLIWFLLISETARRNHNSPGWPGPQPEVPGVTIATTAF